MSKTITTAVITLLSTLAIGCDAAAPNDDATSPPAAAGGKADEIEGAEELHGLVDSFVILDVSEGTPTAWRQTAGLTVELEDAMGERPWFKPERIGTYAFEAELDDGTVADVVVSVHEVVAGRDHTVVLRADGRLFAWGSNEDAQLGIGSIGGSYDAPIDVCAERGECDVAPYDAITSVASGAKDVMVLSGGTVWSWGDNTFGLTGNGASSSEGEPPVPDPAQVCADETCDSPLSDVVQIVAGFRTAGAVRSDGTLWMWGSGEMGAQSTGAGTMFIRSFPTQSCLVGTPRTDDSACLVPLTDVDVFPSTNAWHFLANDAEGVLRSWGSNLFGEGGFNATRDGLQAEAVCMTDGSDTGGCEQTPFTGVVMARAVERNSYALLEDGTLWSWGDNRHDTLGGPPDPRCVDCTPYPRPVCADEACAEDFTDVVSLGGGVDFALAVTSDGRAWSWGRPDDASLAGRGEQGGTTRPAPICAIDDCSANLDNISAVANGARHAFALTRDGQLLAWGDNASGQLGVTAAVERVDTPTVVMTL